MSNPQRVFVGGEWRPLMTGGKPAKECCCAKNCHVIARGLCGTAPWPPCGFKEFDVPGEDPSCPPKYYRTKTTVYTYSHNYTETSSSGGTTFYAHSSESISLTKIETFDESCNPKCTANGSYSRSGGYTEEQGVVPETTSELELTWGPTDDCGSECWIGTLHVVEMGEYAYDVTWPNEEEDCYEFHLNGAGSLSPFELMASPQQPGGSFDNICFSLPSVIKTQTSITESYTLEPCSGYEGSTPSVSGFLTIITTLSDEITLHDSLKELICDEEPCTSTDDPPPVNVCRYCCTDRGNGQEGLAYKDPLTPEGCIVPDSSSLTWEGTNCANPTTRNGRSAKLAVWFKDLIPGETYEATITYKRCSFGKNEEGETIYPSCSWTGPCLEEDPESYETITDEITFTAEAWAEILAWDCQDCAILLKQCQLEDEANDWNLANPEETHRSVSCTDGGFDVPVANEKYTWFHSCHFEKTEQQQ